MANKVLPTITSFNTAIPFDQPLTVMAAQTITGATTFTKNLTGAIQGYGTVVEITANGVDTPDFSAFYRMGAGTWLNDDGAVNVCCFVYTGSKYCVSFAQAVAMGGGGGLIQLSTPGSFSISPNGTDEMIISWGDVANEIGYTVQIAEDAGFTVNMQTASKGVGVLTHTFTGLTADTLYYGRVWADGDGVTYSDSAYASDNASTDPEGLLALTTPGSFTATPVSSTEIELNWTDTNTSPNETSIKVYRNTVNVFGSATNIATLPPNTITHTDTGRTAGVTYYYWVGAGGNGTTTGDSSKASTSATIASTVTYLTAPWLSHWDPAQQIVDDGVAEPNKKVIYVKDLKHLAGTAPNVWAFSDQGNSSQRPKLFASGINSLPAIEYSTGTLLQMSPTPEPAKPVTIVLIVRPLSGLGSNGWFQSSISGSQGASIGHLGSSGHFFLGASGLAEGSITVAINTDYILWAEFYADGTASLWVNGTLDINAGTIGHAATGIPGLRTGEGTGTNTANHRAGQEFLYNGLFSSGDRTTIINSLKSVYGIS